MRDRLIAGLMLPGAWIVKAQKFRALVPRRESLAMFRDFDVLLAPATPCSAPKIGQKTLVLDGQEMLVRPNLGLFTQPISFIGLPVVAVPVWTDGERLPIGVQIIAAPWREDLALRVARALERDGRRQPRRSARLPHERGPFRAGPGATAPRMSCAAMCGRRWSTPGQCRAELRPHPEFRRRRRRRRKRLAGLDAWKRARVVKCNPDPPQIPVRLRALYDGKLLFSPVPYLTKGFPYLRIDPDKLAAKGVDFETAATAQGFVQHGEPVGFEDMPSSSISASSAASRCRGAAGAPARARGFADLEHGIFRELGLTSARDADRHDGPQPASRRARSRGDGGARQRARFHRHRSAN